MDEWIPEELCRMVSTGHNREQESRKRKRRNSTEPLLPSTLEASVLKNGISERNGSTSTSAQERKRQDGGTFRPREFLSTEEELDVRQQKQLTAQRNFDMVIFDVWKIKPWLVISSSQYVLSTRIHMIFNDRYFSPYPLMESEVEELPAGSGNQALQKIQGLTRVTPRSHGRTSELLAGGLLRQHGGESMLWVCHFCFKYMVDGVSWELHKVRATFFNLNSLILTFDTERLQIDSPAREEGVSARGTYCLGS
jgi:histone acetyltransferase MYST1